jgi:7-keto-8-aminopelargonate synthetase-like enzyme
MSVIPAICNLLQMDEESSFIEPMTCFLDQFAHASLYDAVKVSGAISKVFPHNHLDALARALSRSSTRRKLIVIDGLYSAEADLSRLSKILSIAECHDAIVYMDDAHGVGILGSRLGGTADLLGLSNHPNLIIAGTLSKVFGGIGGFVAGSVEFCKFIRVAARASLFSHALPPNMICGFLKALEILKSEGLNLQEKLCQNISLARRRLTDAGLALLGGEGIPIVPVMIGNEMTCIDIFIELLKHGILAPTFRYPATPRGAARIRVTITAAHTADQINHLVLSFGSAVNALLKIGVRL